MNMKHLASLFASTAVLALAATMSCSQNKAQLTKSGLDPDKFTDTIAGKPVALYTLTNSEGLEACITNFGGRIVSLMVPDRDNKLTDVVLGHDSLADYINIDGNFGAIIGRYGNRINHGRITIDSVEYQLPINDNGHSLHGGPVGFHNRVWDAQQPSDSVLVLKLLSPDGEAGYPGNLDVTVTYTLGADRSLNINYEAYTDKPTIVNLTNHAYFNLSGNMGGDILGENLWIDADAYTPIDSSFMTTGEIAPVDNTPFDFRRTKTIGADLSLPDVQLQNGKGYDHNFVLNGPLHTDTPAATLSDPSTGIQMEVLTDQPGIQLYIGNFLDGKVKGKQGIAYPFRSAVCLETQHYPDTPNKPEWPSVRLEPGQHYLTQTTYRFSNI
ncbi:aldose epimerase family protein [uncultured Muribaculum sp.]|uniref:aldose epimerase family protein n=3 Tax=uncultured Muribaculum sp. TaxID=1918613 RepID=UPI00345CA3A0